VCVSSEGKGMKLNLDGWTFISLLEDGREVGVEGRQAAQDGKFWREFG
jgi:hypothetical protein